MQSLKSSAPSTIKSVRDAIDTALANGSPAALITLVQSENFPIGAKILITDEGMVGDLGDATLNEAVRVQAAKFLDTRDEAKTARVAEFAPQLEISAETRVLFERIETEPRLVIAGAGHVGAALARLAALVGYRVTLIDDRKEFVARELFTAKSEASIDLVAAEKWSEAMRAAIGSGRSVSVAIVTRGHKQDEDCLRAAVSGNPDYIGMIGSKRRTNIVLEKLREEEFDEDALKRVRAPIGLDIGAVSPEEVALAILAEIIAERRGGSGGSLSAWRR